MRWYQWLYIIRVTDSQQDSAKLANEKKIGIKEEGFKEMGDVMAFCRQMN